MSLSTRDQQKLTTYLANVVNNQNVRSTLTLGNRRMTIDVKYENYRIIQSWLASLLVMTDDTGVKEAAELIAAAGINIKAVKIEVLTPPFLDVEKEKQKLFGDCAHSKEIDGVYVQLDVDQNKHQPKSQPIGTRKIHGEKFGDYASKKWHEDNTMKYMADWAKLQHNMVENKKVEHGQAKRIDGVSYEGYCILLGGKKFVTFHCYPNSR